jgi:hypothetical protein
VRDTERHRYRHPLSGDGSRLGGRDDSVYLLDSARKKLKAADLIDSSAGVSFILEHIMNKWAGSGFIQATSGGTTSVKKERRG